MASSTPTRHAWRVLLGLLLVTAALFGINALGVYGFKQSSWTPELALDLQGGTQIILSAVTEDGSDPTQEQLEQASDIIRQRVDASGVAEADITTEGGRNIVVQIPGEADEETLERIRAAAQLELRPVIYTTAAATEFTGEDGNATPYPTPDPSANAVPSAEPTDSSDLSWVTEKLQQEFLAYDCANPQNNPSNAPADQPLITCDDLGTTKYILGPQELDGTAIDDATSGRDPRSGAWIVQLDLDDDGAGVFGEISQRLYQNKIDGLSPRDQFAFVLDG